MISIHSNSGRVAYGIKHFDLDTVNDLINLRKDTLTTGSTVFIIDSSKYYMLNGKKQWIEINPYNMGSSNGGSVDGGNPSDPKDEIYDGGSIDGSDPE